MEINIIYTFCQKQDLAIAKTGTIFLNFSFLEIMMKIDKKKATKKPIPIPSAKIEFCWIYLAWSPDYMNGKVLPKKI